MSCAAGSHKRRPSAVVLYSGGLDSMLAAAWAVDHGLRVHGLHFDIPFKALSRDGLREWRMATNFAARIGMPLQSIVLGEEFVEVVRRPRHGVGSGRNPCMDCRILMLRRSGEVMKRVCADFVITGEVLGQRPMSQVRERMRVIENRSGLEGRIVRPLCGALLPPTRPEREGVIARDELLSFSGRARKAQAAMARGYGLREWPTPAGGCLLTEKHFVPRLEDLEDHEGLRAGDIPLLKVGRHFRLPGGSKLVIGRNAEENAIIEQYARAGDLLAGPRSGKGPTALLRPASEGAERETAAAIVAAYSRGPGPIALWMRWDGGEETVFAEPLDRAVFRAWLL